MRIRGLTAWTVFALMLVPAASASAAPAATLLSFDAGHARLTGHGNRIVVRLFAVGKATQLVARPLHHLHHRLGPEGIEMAAKRHSTLSFEVPGGPWYADSMLIRIRDIRARRGRLIVRGNRIAASHLARARRTFNQPDRSLPPRTGPVSLMLDTDPEGPPVLTPDGRSAKEPVVGVLRAPAPRRGRIGGFYEAPTPGRLQVLLFKWIESARLECSAYTLEDAPMTLIARSNLESEGVKPTLLEAPRNEATIHLSTPDPAVPFGNTTVEGFKGSFAIDVSSPAVSWRNTRSRSGPCRRARAARAMASPKPSAPDPPPKPRRRFRISNPTRKARRRSSPPSTRTKNDLSL